MKTAERLTKLSRTTIRAHVSSHMMIGTIFLCLTDRQDHIQKRASAKTQSVS